MRDMTGKDDALSHSRFCRNALKFILVFAVARNEQLHVFRKERECPYRILDTTREHEPRCGEKKHIAHQFAVTILNVDNRLLRRWCGEFRDIDGIWNHFDSPTVAKRVHLARNEI